jgi:uncharacterized repeat protein (TIGR03803 family)
MHWRLFEEVQMKGSGAIRLAIRGVALAAVLTMVGNAAWGGSTVTVIHSFDEAEGAYPDSELVRDSAGNLYGTTVLGGDFGSGTVFQVAPDGTHSLLYSFTSGADGAEPYKGVALDAEGNLYGTTVAGGGGSCEGGCGVTYKLTNNGGTWTQTVLHTFTGGTDGSGPGSALTVDRRGNVYGMTPIGGAFGVGTIYQLHPKQQGGYLFRVIHQFTGGVDGLGGSPGRMIVDRQGNLYGASTVGGAFGNGVVFQLVLNGGQWDLTPLYSFKGDPDVGFPYGGLIFDRRGNLYGTTYYDGAHELGGVYQLHKGSNGVWQERVLYSFQGGTDGANSISGLVWDSQGNLYGTTSEGGARGVGVIFKLAPDGQGGWTESVAYAFTGPPDGSLSYNGMVGDGADHFWGATVHGGDDDDGTVYQFTP